MLRDTVLAKKVVALLDLIEEILMLFPHHLKN
jgi:hypothetical protein